MVDERILTLHPTPGKNGVNIDFGKYEQIKKAIIEVLEKHAELTFTELMETVEYKLEGRFDGSISWYVTTVKLDLEARGIVHREGKSPQKIMLGEVYHED